MPPTLAPPAAACPDFRQVQVPTVVGCGDPPRTGIVEWQAGNSADLHGALRHRGAADLPRTSHPARHRVSSPPYRYPVADTIEEFNLRKTVRVLITTALAGAAALGVQVAMHEPASAAAISTAPCSNKGVSAEDKAIANKLSSQLTAGMGGDIDGYQVSCARAVVEQVQDRGLDKKAATIAIATTMVEGNIHNYSLAVDYDSLGLFQQRPSAGWGSPEELTDPAYATDAFLNRMMEN
jgi:hypothetical protein